MTTWQRMEREELKVKVVALITILFVAACFHLATRFVNAKIANDSSIAQDTRRIAEALERRQ